MEGTTKTINGIAIFLFITISIIAIVAGRPVLGHSETTTEQREKFLISYKAKKIQRTTIINKRGVKVVSVSPVERGCGVIGFYKDRAAAEKEGRERIGEFYLKKDKWEDQSIVVVPLQ